MLFFIPIGHEEGRIWSLPYATFALIVLCVIVFIASQSVIKKENREIRDLDIKIEQLKVEAFRNAQINDDAGVEFTGKVSNYRELSQQRRSQIDDYWQKLLLKKDDALKNPYYQEYQSLSKQLELKIQGRLFARYGYNPSHPSLVTSITSLFLHGSIMHLIGNMFFLFMVGFALEDVWGKGVFLLFYLACGMAADLIHGLITLKPEINCIGASGAIAGLMGASFVRFFKVKIHFAYLFVIILVFRYGRITLPAYLVFPAWLFSQFFYVSLVGEENQNIAYWAHIGGFGFGAIAATPLTYFKFGRKSVSEHHAERIKKTAKKKATRFQDNLAYRKAILMDALNGPMYEDLEKDANDLMASFAEMQNDLDMADLAEKILDTYPQLNLENRYLLKVGALWEHQWRNERALTIYQKVADSLLPGAGKALLRIGHLCHVRLKDERRARRAYRLILEKLPDDPAAPMAKVELKKITMSN